MKHSSGSNLENTKKKLIHDISTKEFYSTIDTFKDYTILNNVSLNLS